MFHLSMIIYKEYHGKSLLESIFKILEIEHSGKNYMLFKDVEKAFSKILLQT